MADLVSAAETFAESVREMPGEFVDVANNGPISAILLAIGALFIGLAVLAFAYLSLGAFVSLFTAETSGRRPRSR